PQRARVAGDPAQRARTRRRSIPAEAGSAAGDRRCGQTVDGAGMTPRTLLHEILAEGGLSVLFQPIFEIGGQSRAIFALEALSRGPKGSNAERADVLFEYVRRKAKEPELGPACLAVALKWAPQTRGTHAISLK